MSAAEVATDIVMRAKDQTKGAFDQLNDNAERSEKAFSAGKLASAAFGAGTAALTGFLSDAARAAADDEANTLHLKAAIEASGGSWADNTAAIADRIKTGQDLAFTDNDTRDSIAQLTAATGDVTKAMEMQSVVQEIARGRQISLGSATDIAQKAALGQFGALKKLGIVIDETMTPTQALGELQKRYAGQAVAYGASTQGAIDRVKDAISEWKESIGAALGPAQGLVAMLPGFSVGFTAAGGALGFMKDNGKQMLALINPITLAKKAWAAAQAVLNVVLSANPIGIVVLALAALAVGLKYAYDNSADFRNIVNQLFDWLGNLLKPLGWVWDRVMDLAHAFGLVGDRAGEMKSDASADFEALKASATTSMASTSTAVVGKATEMKQGVLSVLDQMAAKGVGASEDMKVKSILAAMGMKDSVIQQAEDMASGLGGWSERARDKAIFDMQYAELESTLHAKGLADGVIAEIMRMTSKAHDETEKARDAVVNNVARMKDNMDGFQGTVSRTAADLRLLRQNIEELPTTKVVSIFVNRYEQAIAGAGGTRQFAAGTDYVTYTGPAIIHEGEAVLTREENAARRRGVGAQVVISGDIHIHGNVDSAARVQQVRQGLGAEIVQRMRAMGANV